MPNVYIIENNYLKALENFIISTINENSPLLIFSFDQFSRIKVALFYLSYSKLTRIM